MLIPNLLREPVLDTWSKNLIMVMAHHSSAVLFCEPRSDKLTPNCCTCLQFLQHSACEHTQPSKTSSLLCLRCHAWPHPPHLAKSCSANTFLPSASSISSPQHICRQHGASLLLCTRYRVAHSYRLSVAFLILPSQGNESGILTP